MVEQVIISHLEHEAREKKAKDTLSDILGIFKTAAANEKTIPYIAALGYGMVTGYTVEKTWEGSIRMGLEAVLFTHLASMPDNLPAQTFGVAGLASIGLTLPLAPLLKNFPWIYEAPPELKEQVLIPPSKELPLGEINLEAVGEAINRWWSDILKGIQPWKEG